MDTKEQKYGREELIQILIAKLSQAEGTLPADIEAAWMGGRDLAGKIRWLTGRIRKATGNELWDISDLPRGGA